MSRNPVPVMTQKSDELGYRLLQDLVRSKLRDEILQGQNQPGERLGIGMLARRYGVSPMPVREALRGLEAEGLVEFKANRGAVVKALSLRELKETFLIRIPLECVALREAIPQLTRADHGHLSELIKEMDAHSGDAGRWLELNQQFHLHMYRAANLARLYQIIEGLWAVVRPYLGVYMAQATNLKSAHSEHLQLLDACRQGNATRGAQVLRRHLVDTRDIVVKSLAKTEGRSSGRRT